MTDTMLSLAQRALKMATTVDRVRQAEKHLEEARAASMGADLGDVRIAFYRVYAVLWFSVTYATIGYHMLHNTNGGCLLPSKGCLRDFAP